MKSISNASDVPRLLPFTAALFVTLSLGLGLCPNIFCQEFNALEILEKNLGRLQPIDSYNLKMVETARIDQKTMTIEWEIAGLQNENSYSTRFETPDKIRFACQNPKASKDNVFSFAATLIGEQWGRNAYLHVELGDADDIAPHLDLLTLEGRLGAPHTQLKSPMKLSEFQTMIDSASNVVVQESELDGVSCYVVQLQFDKFKNELNYYIAKDDSRMLLIESKGESVLTSRKVVEWYSFKTERCDLPKRIVYKHIGKGFEHESQVEIVSCAINDKASRQRAQEMRSLTNVPHLSVGTLVTWRDENTFPCQPNDALIWDGEKFVCQGTQSSSVAFESSSNWGGVTIPLIAIVVSMIAIGIWVKSNR